MPRRLNSPRHIPEIVRIVLLELGRRHAAHTVSESWFKVRVARLIEEELAPKGYSLLIRPLSDGSIRFIIKDARNGTVCGLLDSEREEQEEKVQQGCVVGSCS